MVTGNQKSESPNIRTWEESSIWFVQLDNPKMANAYDTAMLHQLKGIIRNFSETDDAKILIISGSGERFFCAGANLKEIRSRNYREGLDLLSAKVFNDLAQCPKVTIAAINGAAIGGGFELALACDLRICSANATFAFPEPGIGLIPAAGGVERLPQIVGVGKAKELILGGVTWNGDNAYQFGLVSRVVDTGSILDTSREWASSIASKNALALELAKNVMNIDTAKPRIYPTSRLSEALLYELQNKAER